MSRNLSEAERDFQSELAQCSSSHAPRALYVWGFQVTMDVAGWSSSEARAAWLCRTEGSDTPPRQSAEGTLSQLQWLFSYLHKLAILQYVQ